MKYSIKDFFSKRGQIRTFLRIWSHLLKKFLMEYFIFCAETTNKEFWETVRFLPSDNVESSKKFALVERDQILARQESCTIFKFDLLKCSTKS